MYNEFEGSHSMNHTRNSHGDVIDLRDPTTQEMKEIEEIDKQFKRERAGKIAFFALSGLSLAMVVTAIAVGVGTNNKNTNAANPHNQTINERNMPYHQRYVHPRTVGENPYQHRGMENYYGMPHHNQHLPHQIQQNMHRYSGHANFEVKEGRANVAAELQARRRQQVEQQERAERQAIRERAMQQSMGR
ncbi:MAG: hypothetical protein FWE45_04630 [Firmicutes bacterium]|nr:hypothetical protein [Bacillota bacterium]